MTVSHLRFSRRPIRSTYLVADAHVVACHQVGLLDRVDVLAMARPGGVFLLNSPYAPERTWDRLPADVQRHVIDKKLRVHIIDGHCVASEVGLPGLISTVMQAAFFLLTDLLEPDVALEALRASIRKAYALLGPRIIEANLAAVDLAAARLVELEIPDTVSGPARRPLVTAGATDFVQRVTARILAGEGDLLPVSAMPVDGAFPTGTARVEKRRLATEIPVWDTEVCIDCARCTLVCPHAAIRMKAHENASPPNAPDGLLTKPFRSHGHPGLHLTIQVAPEDCTGCGVCVDVCPAHSKSQVKHKALNMEPIDGRLEAEIRNWSFFLDMESVEPGLLDPSTVKGAQSREPLFEFSGACSGCGETPYLKLLTQLFGDRSIVANATGCSSIYGANLPTTPWSTNRDGRGPAWSNSLFEDNAEFGLGMRVALDRQHEVAHNALHRLAEIAPQLSPAVAEALLAIDPRQPTDDATIAQQRGVLAELDLLLVSLSAGVDDDGELARRLAPLTGSLRRRNVWIVGGDGRAYDIGSGGIDHVLGSGRDVNVLVLDTEVYSNTGGQASKATPRGAVAKFAAGGKRTAKKDLGVEARRYGNVYVAQIAIGANDVQAVKAFAEAEAWPGPSLIIAYSTCIAHGIDMRTSMTHQKDAVKSGYWPLYRYQPGVEEHLTPFHLDSKAPTLPVQVFMDAETRFATLRRSDPAAAAERALEDGGAAAVVLPSLFEEDADRETSFILSASGLGSLVHAESVPHPAMPLDSLDVAQRHIRLVADAKAALRIPVMASVNGTTPSGWIRHATELGDAGADALELNVYRVAADPADTAQSVEESILALVEAVRARVTVPLAVKIGPYFSALPAFVRRLVEVGANGLVLFNRFYQPDIDLDTLEVRPSLDLSTSADLRLPLRWTAILRGNVEADLAVSGGVHESADVVKSLLVGATAVMTTSSLLRKGPAHISSLRDGLATWMTDNEYESVSQLRGSMAVANVADPDAYERANYVRVIQQASRTYGARHG